MKVNSLKLLIDNSGNSPYNDIKLNWYERLVILCHIKLHLITLKVKIMRIIHKEYAQHFTTVLTPFCLLAVKITPIILCGPTCAHRLHKLHENRLNFFLSSCRGELGKDAEEMRMTFCVSCISLPVIASALNSYQDPSDHRPVRQT